MREKIVWVMLAVVAAGPAFAADLGGGKAPEPPTWTGFYIGAHGGYGWSAWEGDMIYTGATPGDGFDASSHTINGQGALAGGQIGFNYQFGRLVAGLEGDGSWANIKGGTTMLPYPVGFPANGSPAWGLGIENNWLATVRGRLGWDVGGLLFYGTGGVAFGGFHETHTVLGYGYPDSAFSTHNDTKTGWTAGAGFEYALDGSWSAKAEYLYMNFADVGGVMQWAPKYGTATDGFKGDWYVHTARLGVNYRW